MSSIEQRLLSVRQRIIKAEQEFCQKTGQVELLAVSKTFSPEIISEVYGAGQRHFGENYLSEALKKQEKLSGYDIVWHFIGPIQSNKAASIAQHFDWVQSIGRSKEAIKMNEARKMLKTPLNVCIQVNISQEVSKSGVSPVELAGLLSEVAKLPHLAIRGLMAIPAKTEDKVQQAEQFKQLKTLWDQYQPQYQLDTLSMGMSQDLEAAIAAGSTMVRVGTAIFGDRGSAN